MTQISRCKITCLIYVFYESIDICEIVYSLEPVLYMYMYDVTASIFGNSRTSNLKHDNIQAFRVLMVAPGY